MTDYLWNRPEPRRLVRLGGSLGGARFDGGADLGGSRLEGLGEGGNGGAPSPRGEPVAQLPEGVGTEPGLPGEVAD